MIPYGSNNMNKPETDIQPTTIKEIGQYIRAIRKANKLSQQEISDLSGVNRRFLSELENGKPTAEIGKEYPIFKLRLDRSLALPCFALGNKGEGEAPAEPKRLVRHSRRRRRKPRLRAKTG